MVHDGAVLELLVCACHPLTGGGCSPGHGEFTVGSCQMVCRATAEEGMWCSGSGVVLMGEG